MNDLIIKNMDMPKNCLQCRLRGQGYLLRYHCPILQKDFGDEYLQKNGGDVSPMCVGLLEPACNATGSEQLIDKVKAVESIRIILNGKDDVMSTLSQIVEVVEQAPVVQEPSVRLLSMGLSLDEDFSVEQFPLKIRDVHSKNLTQSDIDYLDSKN